MTTSWEARLIWEVGRRKEAAQLGGVVDSTSAMRPPVAWAVPEADGKEED